MRKLIVANWKENPTAERDAVALFVKTASVRRGSGVRVVVCPPTVHLAAIAKKMKTLRSRENLDLGAQDVFWKDAGAFTGEVGPAMLRSLGVRYVIIGHSESRKFAGESDTVINKKVRGALAEGLRVILCVGEPASVRKHGVAAARQFIKKQLKKDLQGLCPTPSAPYPRLLVAYEPIWAIGSGKHDTPADAGDAAVLIREAVRSLCCIPRATVLYGGSTNGKNVMDYIACKEVDGVLVGGSSLKPGEIGRMIGRVGSTKH